jgi:hypothetical protein
MRFYITTLLVLLCAPSLWAGVIKGKVYYDKGVPLPYATIYIQGTTNGVNANGSGDYMLSVDAGLHKVVCQFIGFGQATFNVTISGTETVVHNFILKEESLEMSEVVVRASAEDPAYGIIRSAIKRRKFHLDQVRSFQSSIYFKGVMRSRHLPDKFMGQKIKSADLGVDSAGKGVLYLTEEEADYYSDGDKEKTVIHSVRESGNKGGLGFSRFPSVITFYDNIVSVFGRTSRGFISPVSDNALNYYKYKLLGTFMEDGHLVYKIQVIQRRLYEPCFNGVIYIVDNQWAIHSLDVTLVKESGMSTVDTLRVEQVFLPLQKDNWVIKSQVLYFAVKFMMFDVTATGVAVYNKQRVNEPIPDSIFASKVTSLYDKTANKKDTTHWQDRPVPLELDEQRDFVIKDSLTIVLNSPEYIDSVRRRENRLKPLSLMFLETSYNSKKYKNTYTLNSLFLGTNNDNIINYNIVEGYNVAPKISVRHQIDTGKNLFADVVGRYGFSNEHFNAMGRVYYTTRDNEWLNRSWMYGAEGGKYVFQYNPENPVLPLFNTYRSLFFRENDLKIYERWEAAAFLRRNYGNGFSWFVRASWQQRIPLQNTTDYSILPGDNSGVGDNTPPTLQTVATVWEPHQAALLSVWLSYRPGVTYTQYPDYKVANGSRWPLFTFHYQKGLPGILESKTNFDKWRFAIRDDVRMGLVGSLRYNLVAGGFLNNNYVSFPDLIHLHGMRGFGYTAPYLESFQFAPYYLFSNKETLYGEAHIEYHLNGLLSNKIPLLRQARFYLLFGGNVFYAGQHHYYTETFVGIDNIGWKLFRILRIDFVQSWDSNMGRNSGIRFGLNFRGFNTARKSPTESEW